MFDNSTKIPEIEYRVTNAIAVPIEINNVNVNYDYYNNIFNNIVNNVVNYDYNNIYIPICKISLLISSFGQIIIGLMNVNKIKGCNFGIYPSTLIIINGFSELICYISIVRHEKLLQMKILHNTYSKLRELQFYMEISCWLNLIFFINKLLWFILSLGMLYSKNCYNANPQIVFMIVKMYLIYELILIMKFCYDALTSSCTCTTDD